MCESCSRDVSKGRNNNNMSIWKTHTIWYDHGRRDRGRTPNCCPTIHILGILLVYQMSFKQTTMAPWISEMELWKFYIFLNPLDWIYKITVKLKGNGMEKIYHIMVSWVLIVTHQTPWKLLGVPFMPLPYWTIDVLQTNDVIYMDHASDFQWNDVYYLGLRPSMIISVKIDLNNT